MLGDTTSTERVLLVVLVLAAAPIPATGTLCETTHTTSSGMRTVARASVTEIDVKTKPVH